MPIEHSILHFIHKQQGETESKLHLKETELAASSHIDSLHSRLHEIYHAKAEKGYGVFANPAGLFQQLLQQWQAEELSFVAFSQQSATHFKDILEKEPLASGGHLLMSYERRGMSDFVWIVILHQVHGLAVNEALELSETEYVDLNHLHLAAKINLTEWQNDSNNDRYISFVKGKTAKKVTEYFKNFIGCEETVNPVEQTQQLVKDFQTFCQGSALNPEKTGEYSEKLYDLCKNQAAEGGVVQVNDIASLFDTPDMNAFADNLDQRSIIPHKRSLKQFVQLEGKMGGFSISFQRKLLGNSVFFDADTGVLTITDLPTDLRAQLLEMLGVTA